MQAEYQRAEVIRIPADRSELDALPIVMLKTTNPNYFSPTSKEALLKHIPWGFTDAEYTKANRGNASPVLYGVNLSTPNEDFNGIWYLHVHVGRKDDPSHTLPQNQHFPNNRFKNAVVLGDAFIFKLTERRKTPDGRAEYAKILHLKKFIKNGPLEELIRMVKEKDNKVTNPMQYLV